MALPGIGLGLAIALGVGAIAIVNRDGPTLVPGPLDVAPLVAIVALPAALALVGLRRPAALLAAGVLSLPTAFLSFAGVTLPLLIPACFYLVAYGRAAPGRPRVPTLLIALVVLATGAGAFAAITALGTTACTETVVYRDGRKVVETTTHPGGNVIRYSQPAATEGVRSVETHCSESVATPSAVGTSLGLVSLGAFAAAWMSKPRPATPS